MKSSVNSPVYGGFFIIFEENRAKKRKICYNVKKIFRKRKIGLYKYSASYTNLNVNFIISEIKGMHKINEKDASLVSVVRNILCRSPIVEPSSYLKENLGSRKRYSRPCYTKNSNKPIWGKIIKGGVDSNPALFFYENQLLKLLENDLTKFASFIPEYPIRDVILDSENSLLNDMYLDFYSPLLKCNIEIDGEQHKKNALSDYERDKILKSNGITVVRIKAESVLEDNRTIRKIATTILDNYIEIPNDKKILNYSACIRYQIAILQLLECGALSFSNRKWKFSIRQNECIDNGIFEIAVNDLLLWFNNLLVLQDREKLNIELNISENKDNSDNDNSIMIDLDLFSQYDESTISDKCVYIRNDYFLYDIDSNVTYKKAPTFISCKNYFRVSNGKQFYSLKSITPSKRESLQFFLKNIFGFASFLPKQEEIIFECLSSGSVIGLLPTGAGKSLCYQLSSLLLPGVTLVISPLKVLMKDQYENLKERYGISNICYINSSNKGATDLLKYNQAKICFISPERFFNEEFLKIIKSDYVDVSLIAIDEVHCLSEWGHDFRTSYLCLTHYLKDNLDKNCKLIGLTATASPRVCQDIEIEFANFKGYTKIIQSTSLARPNLKLIVEQFDFGGRKNDDKNTKLNRLDLMCDRDFLNTKTIVFTRTKSIKPKAYSSCYNLCKVFQDKYVLEEDKQKINYFAAQNDTLDDVDENDIKLKDFKDGKTTLLFSTKAFGMGVDIPDIRRTIHYEIPSSIESLYQEFGRAGRDGKESTCYIWLYKEKPDKLENLFNGDFSIKNIDQNKSFFNEIQTNLYFLTIGNLDTKEELFFENYLYEKIKELSQKTKDVEFTADEFIDDFHQYIGYEEIKNEYGYLEDVLIDSKFETVVSRFFDYKNFIDKALYRLFLIGKISMWSVRYSVDIANPIYTNINVLNSTLADQLSDLTNYIKKYEPDYIYNKELSADNVLKELIEWTFNHFVYQRLQSIKNIYESCMEYKNSAQFMKMIVRYLARDEENNVLLSNPNNYEKWFEVLKTISPIELKSIIARYLESDDKLVSLNFVSGMLRLLLDDFDDADGKRRLKLAFESIKSFNPSEQEIIIKKSFELLKDNAYKDLLAQTILEVSDGFTDNLYKIYQNEEIESHIVMQMAKKLFVVGETLNDRYRKSK